LFAAAPLANIRRVNLKAALLATATVGAFLFVAACGGGGNDSSDSSGSSGSTGSGSMSSGGSGSSGCQPQTETTVIGGQLQVAQSGSLFATLVSSPTPFTQAFFDLVWPTGLQVDVANHQIDAIAVAQPGPAWSGTTVELRPLQPGTPIVLRETLTHPSPTPAETATTGNDLGTVLPGANPIARVTFGPNNTALVTFPSFGAGPDYVLRLSNVTSFGSAGGC